MCAYILMAEVWPVLRAPQNHEELVGRTLSGTVSANLIKVSDYCPGYLWVSPCETSARLLSYMKESS